MNNALTIIDPIRQALALAQGIPELKQVRDTAEAAKAWARSRGLGIDAENAAAEYILRAERKLGEYLIEMNPQAGAQVGSRHHAATGDDVIIKGGLYDQLMRDGILSYKRQAAEWQTLARLADEQFEALLSDVKASGTRIAKINFYRADKHGSAEAARPTSEDPHFDAFRKGAMGLLGWVVDEEHPDGHSTVNRLKQLPNDELALLARLIGSLVNSYQAAKADR